jgi:hypothetical protein
MSGQPAGPVPDAADAEAGTHDEPPPILGRWPVLYAAVIGELVLVIAACYGLSRWGR